MTRLGNLTTLLAFVVAASFASHAAADRKNAPSHDLGFATHVLHFRTEDGGRYTLTGVAGTYDYWVGRQFGLMIHVAGYSQLRGRQASGGGNDFSGRLRDIYTVRWGIDGSAMLGMHWELGERLHLYAGLGVHLQTAVLNGPTVRPVEVVTMGLGSVTRIRYDFHPNFHISGVVAMALDPLDLVRKHENRSVIAFPVSIGVSLGAHYR